MKQYFKSYVANKKLKLKVCPPEKTPLIQFGILYDKDKDIKEILLEQFPNIRRATTFEEPPKLLVGERRSVRVAYLESLESFFVHLEEEIDALDKLMSHITVMAANLPPLKQTQLTEGTPCLALYEVDRQWYRAQIISVKNDIIKVIYIDYGNEETVRSNSLKTITEDLVTVLKSQAIKCTLKGFHGRSGDSKLLNRFEQKVMSSTMILSVEQKLTNSYIVDLLDVQTLQSVALQLKGETATENSALNSFHNDKNADYRRCTFSIFSILFYSFRFFHFNLLFSFLGQIQTVLIGGKTQIGTITPKFHPKMWTIVQQLERIGKTRITKRSATK